MPNKDGTGPAGKGPRTGRQTGKCKGNAWQKNENRMGLRNSLGKGQGRGMGRQNQNQE